MSLKQILLNCFPPLFQSGLQIYHITPDNAREKFIFQRFFLFFFLGKVKISITPPK